MILGTSGIRVSDLVGNADITVKYNNNMGVFRLQNTNMIGHEQGQCLEYQKLKYTVYVRGHHHF